MKKTMTFILAGVCLSLTTTAQWTTNASGIYYIGNNVGIGTSAPAQRLTVGGGHFVVESDDNLASFVELMNFNSIVFKSGSAYGGLHFVGATNTAQANWSDHMILTDAGSLGIGTSTPATTLDVHGIASGYSFYMDNTGDNVVKATSGSNIYHLIGAYPGWDNTAVYIAASHAGNASKTNYPATTQRVNIGNPYFDNNYLSVNLISGAVGIGTTSTGSFRLAVEGSIGARKMQVTTTTPFPDYVFNPGYNLTSLDSLHAYIAANHRLPEMPSADSVQKNGLDLGDNQVALLKKIEELTLYIIRQDGQLKEQQQQIAELRAMVKK